MYIQKIFKAGNSAVVAIPSPLLQQQGLKIGQRVAVEMNDNRIGFIIRKANGVTNGMKKRSASSARKDFQKWLSVFMDENKEILDELAVR